MGAGGGCGGDGLSTAFIAPPWQASPFPDASKAWCIEDGSGQYLGEVNGCNLADWEFQQIARLWAAAPELLAALQAVDAYLEKKRPMVQTDERKALVASVRAAISKAVCQ